MHLTKKTFMVRPFTYDEEGIVTPLPPVLVERELLTYDNGVTTLLLPVPDFTTEEP